MKEDIQIREYKKHDKDSVLTLLRLNTPQYFSPEEEKDLLYYLENELEYYFLLEMNGEVVGCGGLNFSGNPQVAKISWDIVHPQYQGKGLGTVLLNFRIERLKNFPGLKKITVRTSQLAYKFYEKSGFEVLEIVEDYWAEGYHLYNMQYSK